MELPIIVEYVTYPKKPIASDTGFKILACNLDAFSAKYKPEMEELVEDCINKKYNSFTVSVVFPDPNENPKGGQYIVVGDFVVDKKYGKQFKGEFIFQDKPTTEDGMLAFLCSLPNIKESRSRAVLDRFGVEGTIDVLDNDIYKLTEVNGITEKRIPTIEKAWNEKKHLRDLYTWFTLHEIKVTIADVAYKIWGKDTLKTIQENPYKLAELRGIGFITADKIAHKISKDIPLDSRVTACIKYILEEACFSKSNLCVPYLDLKKILLAVLGQCDQNLNKNSDGNAYIDAVSRCLKSNLDKFTIVKDLVEKKIYIYLSGIWKKEYFIVKEFHNRKIFNHANKNFSESAVSEAEANVSEFNKRKIVLDESQKEAIKSAFQHKISVITGPGGSGKSMICRCIFSIAKSLGMTVRMMSPTGKAAQVLSEKTGCGASTIHRGLRMKPGDDMPRELIKEDILLIDEISMSGIDTMYAIMQALKGNEWANIIFVGDKNQLPSVSSGNFLSDIIASGCAHVVTLDKIHRQDENSYISLLANDISKGKVVTIPEIASDIKWHRLRVDTFKDDLLSFIDKYIASGKSIEDLQIVSPMKKGSCGVYAINEMMQIKMAQVNKTESDILSIGFSKFHKGDRVIQIENNYDKLVFNGDMGVIKDLGETVKDPSSNDKKEKFITVEFYGEELIYYGTEIDQLQLAWAITVHKFQGSQSKYIVFIMAEEAQILMSKELVYTAFTRAEKQLDVFGHENMLRVAPGKSSIRERFTNFKLILNSLTSNQKVLEVMEKKEEKV